MTGKRLLLAVGIAIFSVPALAQLTAIPAPPPTAPERSVEGATADRVATVEQCQGQKFESLVEIDPVKKRTTRVKLCANPGASDSEWVKTLEAAIAQIEQRNMPPEAKQKLIAELRAEVARFASAPKAVTTAPVASLFPNGGSGTSGPLIEPTERFETSKLPPLPDRKVAAVGTSGSKTAASRPAKPMAVRLKCLARGESGAGGTCDFLERDTVLAVTAIEGLEAGGTLRFLRKGEARGEAPLAPMVAGRLARVRLPVEVCRGVANTRVEIELLAPGATGVASARLGPYGVRC